MKRRTIPVRLKEEAIEALNDAAKRLGVSRETVVRKLLSIATPNTRNGRDIARIIRMRGK